jgi:thiamine biosynthesis lipoprotein
MGTTVTIEVVHPSADSDEAVDRAFGWFYEIEARCTRFSESELTRLTAHPNVPVPASPILYEAVRFALLAAEETGGAFDPTVGQRMEAQGFNREHRTGEIFLTTITPDDDASYRDVVLDPERRTILLRHPLTLDLGAVAKGLAIDTAARELEPFRDFAIDAGATCIWEDRMNTAHHGRSAFGTRVMITSSSTPCGFPTRPYAPPAITSGGLTLSIHAARQPPIR